jgi:hypothetical protein
VFSLPGRISRMDKVRKWPRGFATNINNLLFADADTGEETVVAEACNHPNCLMLPLRLELIRLEA